MVNSMPVAWPRSWVCSPKRVMCESGHVVRFDDRKGDMRAMQGPLPIRCDACRPSTYFLAVFVLCQQTTLANCYALAESSYKELNARTDDTYPEIPKLLFLLRDPSGDSINPSYQDAK